MSEDLADRLALTPQSLAEAVKEFRISAELLSKAFADASERDAREESVFSQLSDLD